MPYESVRYPRSRAACEACHLPGTYALPSPGVLPSRLEERTCTEDPALDKDALCEPFSSALPGSWVVSATFLLSPETAACTSCHDQPYVAVHAEVNTSLSGAEACATCHGPGSALDVEVVHSR